MAEAGVKCCQVETNCSSFVELCNPAWLVPLHIPERVLTIHYEVIYSGIGPYLESHRLTLHLDGFSYLVNNTRLGNRLGEEAQLPSIFHSVPINCVPNLSPNCVVGSLEMSNHVIFTSSEFEKMMFLKIQAGILELQANHSKIPAYVTSENYSLVLDGCVSKMVGPVQSSIHTVTVLSLGDEQDKEKVFMAVLEKGKPANFTEQRDSSGKNVCQFLINLLDNAASYSCQVISGSISGVKTGSFVVLVMLETASTETFRVLPFEGSSMEWKALFHFPTLLQSLETESPNWQRIESNFTAEGSEVASLLSLTDISFTPVACESLFIWGNVLFFRTIKFLGIKKERTVVSNDNNDETSVRFIITPKTSTAIVATTTPTEYESGVHEINTTLATILKQ
ncbi:uncharacterized protein LOC111330714 [Stylophora pistillata]|uniref:uncharacterized protein LOC111330714 n=1 Tax=Stylophora pistillata TaxID=50429 RepID=UPI000C047E52|nr:uncharacterized protein LOC111330714 [Stylophora pistillata]